jgi:Xaa-Pro aminopeptidase
VQRDCPYATLCKANEIVENQRLIKSPAEFELLKRAAQLADGILKAGLEAIRPGVPSWQIEQRMCAAGVESGADFIPRNRVCFGKMTSHLNWKNADLRAVENGDYVLLEAAGWCAGYGFECKRVVVAGDRSKEQQDYLEHLAEAAEWMIATLKTNAQGTFFMAESRGREIHAVGNGIGLEICENPIIRIEKPIKLMAGMVLSIKPSVSSHQFGRMAVGDMVLMTEGGSQVLSQLPRLI